MVDLSVYSLSEWKCKAMWCDLIDIDVNYVVLISLSASSLFAKLGKKRGNCLYVSLLCLLLLRAWLGVCCCCTFNLISCGCGRRSCWRDMECDIYVEKRVRWTIMIVQPGSSLEIFCDTSSWTRVILHVYCMYLTVIQQDRDIIVRATQRINTASRISTTTTS